MALAPPTPRTARSIIPASRLEVETPAGRRCPRIVPVDSGAVNISELQDTLRRTYLHRDRARGTDGTFRWMVEEVGELARALRDRDRAALEHEFGDVLAWLGSLANLTDVDLERAAARYAGGCPRCGSLPCACEPR
jgi:NTP pyrophosphatase (non-canonical NTP hydrolase)